VSNKPSKARTDKPNAFVIEPAKGETEAGAIARVVLDPIALAAFMLADANKTLPEVNGNAFVGELNKHAAAVAQGDLSRVERMMVAHLHVLDGLFYALVNRSRANSKEGHLDAAETYMKLGLRAQSQCRATAEAIAEIKNPAPVAFVKQANIAAGPQQVNNAAPADRSRAREIENRLNKLLEADNGERMDTGTAGAAGRANPELVPVGEIDGTEDS
jgi:hypothetical protein